MTTYMATITASPYSDLFKGYSTSGMYFRMYNKIAKKFNCIDNKLIIENQKNGRPHIHSLIEETQIPLEDLQFFLSEFYELCKNPSDDPTKQWTTTHSRYNGNPEYNYGYTIKLQVFDNKEDYLKKHTKTECSVQEASYIWYKSLQSIQQTNNFYKIFLRFNKNTKTTRNNIINNFDSQNYDKWFDFMQKSTSLQLYEFIKQRTSIISTNTPNKIVKPLNPFNSNDLNF